MSELGQFLQKARKSKKLDLNEIAAQTKIQLAILEKIEAGDYSSTAKAQTKGFIRQYGNLLGVDSEQLNQFLEDEFSDEVRIYAPTTSSSETRQANILWFRAPTKTITFIGLSFIIILLLIIYVTTLKIQSYSREQVTANNQVVQNVMNKLDKELPDPATSTNNDESSTGMNQASSRSVVLFSSGEVEITAKWSTGKSETINLSNNHKHTFYYSEEIELDIANAGLVKISVDGGETAVAGLPGEKVSLKYK